MEPEEDAPEERHEDQGAEEMIEREGHLGFEDRHDAYAERARDEVPLAEGGPHVVRDRHRHADRREERDGLHAEQDPRSNPAAQESDEHIAGDHLLRSSTTRAVGGLPTPSAGRGSSTSDRA